MIQKRNFSLNVLDEYARVLTYSQVTRLYEAKTNKKFNKSLFEKTLEIPTGYTFYIDNSIIYDYMVDEYDISGPDDVIEFFERNWNGDLTAQFTEREGGGVILITSDPTVYEEILMELEEFGIPSEIVTDGIDPRYLNEN